MTLPTPNTDTVDKSRRAMAKFESDKQTRRSRRLDLAKEGNLELAPGRW